ncbi:MAG: phosphoglycerate dehydrogenase [Armatimonadota bacterium]|nr:phosphoglycerate dehydrogenase [Armatimonadota bacterium]MDR7444080.1 phosphoglycerate dehydrogenase [Armatimonadota bacterium]MDR7569497.1 phosphoglycerate dehydrogenase [Armatimonadota bacterium]MDR7613529.1 phosphoglycerate dehydrogenase [Armatimonadota bacterium]
MEARPKILVADGLSEAGLRRLREAAEVEVYRGLDEAALRDRIRGVDALIVRSATRVTASIFQAADRLRVVARAGVGTDNVDVEAATRAGVLVLNTPEASVRATAEHTLALLLALCRNIPQANAALREGEWARERFVGTELYGKTLGIVGLGRIGSEVARRAQAFGMRVIAHDPYLSDERAAQLGVTLVPFEVLLREADLITLHVPLNPQTRGMLNAEALRKTKRGVRIVNCARGGLVDEEALLGALEEGHVAGAALDVFETEPPRDLRLVRHPRVVATPHLGASTREAQEAIGLEVAEQVLEALAGRLPRGAVNVAAYRTESWERVAPHLELARILGALSRQLARGRIRSVEVRLEGELSRVEGQLLSASFLVGLLEGVVERTVNLVNAHVVATERGLRVVEVRQEQAEDFSSLMLATTHTDEGTWVLGGTLFGRREPRIVRINEHTIDLAPATHMLFVWNLDRPGMIGKVGTILGRHAVNIAGMYLGRAAPGGVAVMVLTTDQPTPPEAVEEIRRVDGIYGVQPVQL